MKFSPATDFRLLILAEAPARVLKLKVSNPVIAEPENPSVFTPVILPPFRLIFPLILTSVFPFILTYSPEIVVVVLYKSI